MYHFPMKKKKKLNLSHLQLVISGLDNPYSHCTDVLTFEASFNLIRYLLYSYPLLSLLFALLSPRPAHHNLGPLQIETAQIIQKIRDHLSPNTGYFGVIFLVSQSERATLAPTELLKYANCRSGPIVTQQNTGILSDSISVIVCILKRPRRPAVFYRIW